MPYHDLGEAAISIRNVRWKLLTTAFLTAALSASVPAASVPKRGDKTLPAPAVDPFCTDKSARIMILGTYHFSNPGLDAKKFTADDVLAPRRQAEIEELTEKLAAFKPTKIMVEAPFGDLAIQRAYRNYLAGTYVLNNDETQQIGFRLSKKLNLKAIYPIDFQMRMSGLRPDEVDDNWRPKPSSSVPAPTPSAQAAVPPTLSEEEQLLRASTISEELVRKNDPATVEAEHSRIYMDLLLPEDSAAIYARPDYLVNWYKRNLRMFANVARFTQFPQDNVVVIVGSGHLKILRDLARDAPYFCLVEPNAYIAPAPPSGGR